MACIASCTAPGSTTGDDDPEGTLQTMVRRVVGPEVPVVATYDLHANVSEPDIATAGRLYRLPHQPASRHARPRRRVRRRCCAA